jgi:preprotein translocase subunit SecG
MTTVVIVVHLMVVLAMIGLVLLQRSEGGALGIGGGQGAFMSNRSAGNVLTRSTAVLAVAFFATSLGLALISKYQSHPSDILERLPGQSAPAATETPAPPTPSGGAPATAEELLKQLGGESGPSGGPQTPPAGTTPTAPEAQAPAAPAPAAQAPAAEAPVQAPAGSAPAAETAPAPQTPPATDGSTQ